MEKNNTPPKTIFLDASVLKNKAQVEEEKTVIQYDKIQFEFPTGFADIRLIEECRAMNALDVSIPDNFDLIYDITMQMLIGKPVIVYFKTSNGALRKIAGFVVTDRYMNLRSVDIIDTYPILVNWLVEFIAGYLSKKYPRSLESIQARMSENAERMKSLQKNGVEKVKVYNPLG